MTMSDSIDSCLKRVYNNINCGLKQEGKMKKRKICVLTAMSFALLFVSCGDKNNANNTTKLLDVNQGISFKQSTEYSQQQESLEKIELTEADLEGMSEMIVTVLKDAVIYSNPSLEASKIGEVKRGNRISVYGKIEDDKWCVVSYNGRVGYVLSEYIDISGVSSLALPTATNQESDDVPSQQEGTIINSGNIGGAEGSGTSNDSDTSEEDEGFIEIEVSGGVEEPSDTDTPEDAEDSSDSGNIEGSEDSGNIEIPDSGGDDTSSSNGDGVNTPVETPTPVIPSVPEGGEEGVSE